MSDLNAIAEIVDTAAHKATAIAQLSETGNNISLEQAYEVQRLSIARREARGEQVIGVKMGFTSRAKQVQMGLRDEIYGHLTNSMRVSDGGEIDITDYVHPRAEPELAFLLKKPLSGTVTLLEAMAAIEAVAPAIEIIDSRYMNFKFNLPDVVADNTSSSSFVTGPWHLPGGDYANLGIILEFDGEPRQIGSTAAILGHPARALASAARLCGQHEIELQPGWVIMAGGATAAEALAPGDSVRAVVEGLGRPAFSVKA
ncbi:MAG: 4-oxalocrotonate decarboxylase [Hyphomonas sp. BRH_c22]|uniref:2-keto-4-pentenoate hydratase n=1 Tax=Hyphomonas sp. BRH_c22 TaxID=1629710 RepID=UPI0005F19D3A|nr:fumarylacetoacetate hydrolase family protein [Hyphomonas sp. BRH_c22]KJS36313.1 MAG: 4-oxalocrotonate decarboxylase [Hyphomonas sp. BRH_c22]